MWCRNDKIEQYIGKSDRFQGDCRTANVHGRQYRSKTANTRAVRGERGRSITTMSMLIESGVPERLEVK